jgi:hypothetical protein
MVLFGGEDNSVNLNDTWTFAQTTVTLTQGSPTSAVVTYGAGYNGHVLTVTNSVGTVTFTEATSTDSSNVVVGDTGAISVATPLAPGTHTASGNDIDTSGDTGVWIFSLTVAQAPQAIAFTSTVPSDAVVGSSYMVRAAGGASGRAVTFRAKLGCTVSDSRMRLIGVGRCVVQASQAGNANYFAATPVTQSFRVVKATSRTALRLSTTKVTYGQEQLERLSVTVSPQFFGTPTGRVTIRESGAVLCTATLSSSRGACRLSPKQLSTGTYHVVVTYRGSTDFHRSTSTRETFTVVR